jgi:hypothetical protein
LWNDLFISRSRIGLNNVLTNIFLVGRRRRMSSGVCSLDIKLAEIIHLVLACRNGMITVYCHLGQKCRLRAYPNNILL